MFSDRRHHQRVERQRIVSGVVMSFSTSAPSTRASMGVKFILNAFKSHSSEKARINGDRTPRSGGYSLAQHGAQRNAGYVFWRLWCST